MPAYQPAPTPTYQHPAWPVQAPAKLPFGPVSIAAIVAAIIALTCAIIADSEPVITARGPAMVAIIGGFAGFVLALAAFTKPQYRKTLATWALVLSIAAGGWGVASYVYAQHQMDKFQACMNAVSNSLSNLGDQSASDAADAACQN
jgi:hypothetical protein